MGVSRSGGEWSCQQAFAKFSSGPKRRVHSSSITSDCVDCSSLDTLDPGHTIKHTPGTRASGSGEGQRRRSAVTPQESGWQSRHDMLWQ